MKTRQILHKVICDGPKCAERHAVDEPMVIGEFDEDLVRTDINAMPDAFARLLELATTPFNPKAFVFCSPSCVRDFLQYVYQEELSPREKSAQAQNNTPPQPDQRGDIADAVRRQFEEVRAGG